MAYADEANLITRVLIWERGGSKSKKEMGQWKEMSEKRDEDSLLLVSRLGKKLRVQACRQSLEVFRNWKSHRSLL